MTERLAVGTAQFGMPYGIANRTGQISSAEICNTLKVARAGGICTLDTAAGYGASELALGEAGVSDWDVVTKISALPEGTQDVSEWIHDQIQASLKRLRLGRVHGLMLHHSQDLLSRHGERIFASLQDLKGKHLVKKIGYSVYAPEELENLWANFPPDIVQIPFNVFDRRMKFSGWLEKMHAASVEIHSRSSFLQGLLLMDDHLRPAKFGRWNGLWDKWRDWLNECNLTPLQGALACVRSEPEIDRFVVGVDSAAHLKEILEACLVPAQLVPESLSIDDERLINPFRWSEL
jgi:aryl-alcohol dehydrogenase-like predicted oxidoreductase